MMCASYSTLMGNLFLLLGLASAPDPIVINGTCYDLKNVASPCVLKTQVYGTRYIHLDGKLYKFRPVFWNIYELSIDGVPSSSAYCSVRGDNQYCLNSVTFISNQ